MVSACTVDDVLINGDLELRPVRAIEPELELRVLRRLAEGFASESGQLLKDAVEAVCELCDADSAGVTLLELLPDGTEGLRWVATTGRISELGLQSLPRYHSPCGLVLDREAPQLFLRPGRYFTYIEESWKVVELLLIPWQIGATTRGTLWALMQNAERSFDREDVRRLQNLVVFASAAISRSEAEAKRRTQEEIASAAKVANQLAHAMNNPLQALTNSLYLIDAGAGEHLADAKQQLERLSSAVRVVLASNAGGQANWLQPRVDGVS